MQIEMCEDGIQAYPNEEAVRKGIQAIQSMSIEGLALFKTIDDPVGDAKWGSTGNPTSLQIF